MRGGGLANRILLISLAIVACLPGATLRAAAQARPGDATAQQRPPRPDNIRIFLDCSYYCDEDFIRKEITFVDYMRDRRDADVHILVTTQPNGGGGTEYTLKFIGLGPYAGVEQTLRYNAPRTATSDETRNGISETLKRGLVRYVSESPIGQRLRITLTGDKRGGPADSTKDPWNLWVFRTNFGGSFEGEEATKSRSFRGSASANRTTEAWKITFAASTRYSESQYDLGDGEIYTSVSRTSNANGLVVKSLSSHWSTGLVVDAYASTYVSFGLSYSFGSIFNNVVNPRFGGGGDFFD